MQAQSCIGTNSTVKHEIFISRSCHITGDKIGILHKAQFSGIVGCFNFIVFCIGKLDKINIVKSSIDVRTHLGFLLVSQILRHGLNRIGMNISKTVRSIGI